MSRCRTQHGPQYTWRCTHLRPWSCNQMQLRRSLCLSPNLLRQHWFLETQSSGLWFAAFTHAALSTVPKGNWFAHQCPPGRFWDFTSGEHTPDPQGNTTVTCCAPASFLARSSNVYSTRRQHASPVRRLRALIKTVSQLLSRKDDGLCGEEIMVLGI